MLLEKMSSSMGYIPPREEVHLVSKTALQLRFQEMLQVIHKIEESTDVL